MGLANEREDGDVMTVSVEHIPRKYVEAAARRDTPTRALGPVR